MERISISITPEEFISDEVLEELIENPTVYGGLLKSVIETLFFNGGRISEFEYEDEDFEFRVV